MWEEGQRFRPTDLEGHRQTALVTVITDGDLLVRHARDNRRETVAALLRALASWEHLAFVDFSESRDLGAETKRYGVPCIEPEAVPSFFGLGVARTMDRQPTDRGILRTWKAALALAPRAVEHLDAYAVRRHLDLDVSPWALRRLAPAAALGVDLEDQRAAESGRGFDR